MKILFLSCWYPSEADPLKGVFVKAHAQTIHGAGEEIMVLAMNVRPGSGIYNKNIRAFTDEKGFQTHLIEIRSVFYKWLYINPFFIRAEMSRYVRKHLLPGFVPDVIHSNILYPCALAGDFISKELKKPHVITEHWSKIGKYFRKNVLSSMGRTAYRDARAITVVSGYLRDVVSGYVEKKEKVRIVPNVIDTRFFSYAPKQRKEDKVVFTCMATWKLPKLPHLFVSALMKFHQEKGKKVELNFIGDGPQLNEIRNMNPAFPVHYHGNLKRNEVAALLQRSDFFLHASEVETFSMVVAEALSTGTPVIASNVGGIPELVNPSNGILCENTVEEWKKAILKASDTSFDHAVIASAFAGRFSDQAVGKMFSDIYRNL